MGLKITIISDTHAGHNQKTDMMLRRQSEGILEDPPDVLLHKGDIGETQKKRMWFFNLYRDLDCVKLCILGNHDLWIDSERKSMKVKYIKKRFERILTIGREAGWQWLREKSFVKGNVAIVGRMMGFDGTHFPMGRSLIEMWDRWIQGIDGVRTRYPEPDIKRSLDPYGWYKKELAALLKSLSSPTKNLAITRANTALGPSLQLPVRVLVV